MHIDPAEHARFADALSREAYWTVTNPRRAFRLAWGPLGPIVFWVGAAVSLAAPVAWLAHISVSSRNFWILAWAPVPIFITLISNRTAFGLLISLVLFLVIGLPLAFLHGRVHVEAALVPGGAYVVVTVVRNVILRAFLRRLARSPVAWRRVCSEGLLSQR